MSQKIYIAGHTGLVGSALVRYFSQKKSVELVVASHSELDLTVQADVEKFVARTKPDAVIMAAGKVGGIQANSKLPAEFIYQNTMMQANVVHASWKAGVKRLINFGSACMYPKECPQPMTPDLLMTGKIEPTNEPYALAKLAGHSLCQSYNRQYGTSYITLIPGNLYGPCDNFDLDRCHVVAALIRRFHEARVKGLGEMVLWGSGEVVRDFLFIDDFPQACDLALEKYHGGEPLNVSASRGVKLKEAAQKIAAVIGFQGKILWDTSRPDGASIRLLDASAVEKLGWKASTDLETGLKATYNWFLEHSPKETMCAS